MCLQLAPVLRTHPVVTEQPPSAFISERTACHTKGPDEASDHACPETWGTSASGTGGERRDGGGHVGGGVSHDPHQNLVELVATAWVEVLGGGSLGGLVRGTNLD